MLETAFLRSAFDCAVHAAHPGSCLTRALGEIEERGPALVLGAGKAAAAMAAAFHAEWERDVRGLVVTRYEHGLRSGEDAGAIEVLEAGHPLPDGASVNAGVRLLEQASSLSDQEQLYWLVSGGGSALAAAPLPPLTFEQKRDAADFLIRAGADIREINCVRKHLSGLKGGRLARAAHPNRVTTFAISDVPGDEIADIASGPTIPDPTTQTEALAILRRYEYPATAELERVLLDPGFESPKPTDPAFSADRRSVIATAATALSAAGQLLRERGYEVVDLGDDLAAQAHLLGREHAQIALQYKDMGRKVAIMSGGETRVVLRKSNGRGGRNLEYLAGLALGLDDAPGIHALAADTDGIDGNGGHAGGYVVPGIVAAGDTLGISLAERLDQNDCYSFFEACDTLLITGPTRTNVNDFRLILCEP